VLAIVKIVILLLLVLNVHIIYAVIAVTFMSGLDCCAFKLYLYIVMFVSFFQFSFYHLFCAMKCSLRV